MSGLIALGLVMLAAIEAEQSDRRPPEAHTAPLHAADHVATMEVNRGSGPPGLDRHVVTRSGSWVREKRSSRGSTVTHHSDLATNTTISYWRDDRGIVSGFSVRRDPSWDHVHRYRRMSTGQRDQALGESCEIWRTTHPVKSDGVEWLSCETPDGIQLWSRAQSIRDGSVYMTSRTISFQRRKVRSSEVLPPRELLRWSYWKAIRNGGSPRPPPASAKSFDVQFKGSGSSRLDWQTMRRRGRWSRTESGTPEGRWLDVSNDEITLFFETEFDGRPVSLSVSRQMHNDGAASRHSATVPVQPLRTEHIVGENCTWSKSVGGGEITITSGSGAVCVSSDGIPLRIHSSQDFGLTTDLTATSIDRGRPPLSEMMPPAEAFDLNTWGINLDR